jgi:hypothetical protein
MAEQTAKNKTANTTERLVSGSAGGDGAVEERRAVAADGYR